MNVNSHIKEINDKLKAKQSTLKLIDIDGTSRNSVATVYCNKCNATYKTKKMNLLRSGCSVCNGKTVVAGVNDILTTHNWVKDYLCDIQLSVRDENNNVCWTDEIKDADVRFGYSTTVKPDGLKFGLYHLDATLKNEKYNYKSTYSTYFSYSVKSRINKNSHGEFRSEFTVVFVYYTLSLYFFLAYLKIT
jgi:hypothetical protein